MTESERRLLVESNYGRTLGWDVSADDEHIAILSDPSQVDMFWYRYKVEARAPKVWEASTWDGALVFRNRGTGHVASNAFAGGERPTLESPYVLMRALYIPAALRWRERLANYWR